MGETAMSPKDWEDYGKNAVFPDAAWGRDSDGRSWKDYAAYPVPFLSASENEITQALLPAPPFFATYFELQQIYDLQPQRPSESPLILAEAVDFYPSLARQLGMVSFPARGAIVNLLDLVDMGSSSTAMKLKIAFNRARPYQIDKSLATLFDQQSPRILNPGHPSYPSGHATEAFACATTLVSLLPVDPLLSTRAALIFKAAYQIAKNREIAGVHFASDSVAGMMLGNWVAQKAISSSVLSGNFKGARAELTAVLKQV
jgi:membrane-associated phospholipid phosphatase